MASRRGDELSGSKIGSASFSPRSREYGVTSTGPVAVGGAGNAKGMPGTAQTTAVRSSDTVSITDPSGVARLVGRGAARRRGILLGRSRAMGIHGRNGNLVSVSCQEEGPMSVRW